MRVSREELYGKGAGDMIHCGDVRCFLKRCQNTEKQGSDSSIMTEIGRSLHQSKVFGSMTRQVQDRGAKQEAAYRT